MAPRNGRRLPERLVAVLKRTDISYVDRLEIILGPPHLRRGPLLDMAREIGATALVSANAFSRWSRDDAGVRDRAGWDLRTLANARGLALTLDSAGFTAMARYRGFLWSAERYVLDLAAAWDFRWFAAMDLVRRAGDRARPRRGPRPAARRARLVAA